MAHTAKDYDIVRNTINLVQNYFEQMAFETTCMMEHEAADSDMRVRLAIRAAAFEMGAHEIEHCRDGIMEAMSQCDGSGSEPEPEQEQEQEQEQEVQ